MGYLATRDGQTHPRLLSIFEFMDAAVELGLAGVDIPLPASIPPEQIRDALQERGLRIVTEFMTLLETDSEVFRRHLHASALVGAKVVRAMISRILCGDR